MLDRQLSPEAHTGCPKTFPPISLSMENEVQVGFMSLFEMLTEKELKQVMAYIKAKNPSNELSFAAIDAIYDGLYRYFTHIGMDTKLTPEQCGDLTVEILQYCKKRYQNVRQNIADVLRVIPVTGSPEDPKTQQRFLQKVEQLLPILPPEEREEMLVFRDKFNTWFINPLALCFEESGVLFSLLDGSLKFVSNCRDKKAHVAGGCGIAVEDIIASRSMLLGWFHSGGKVSIPYADMESETPEEAREEAKGLLYPPKPEYPFSNTTLKVLQAISSEDAALFDAVKEKVEDWEFKDPYGMSLVHHAAGAKNPYFLKHIMTKHASLSVKDEQHLSPLHHAAQKGALECIQLLVRENPDLLESKAQNDETPLFLAIQSGAGDSVDLLLRLGANPNCTIINDLSALLWAIQSKNESLALKLLNHKRIDIDYSLKDNNSAIELAIDMELPQILKKLIQLGANVNRRVGGYTPLHFAVSIGYLEGVKILLECKEVQVNLLTSSGESALALARRYDYVEIEQLLLAHHAR